MNVCNNQRNEKKEKIKNAVKNACKYFQARIYNFIIISCLKIKT